MARDIFGSTGYEGSWRSAASLAAVGRLSCDRMLRYVSAEALIRAYASRYASAHLPATDTDGQLLARANVIRRLAVLYDYSKCFIVSSSIARL